MSAGGGVVITLPAEPLLGDHSQSKDRAKLPFLPGLDYMRWVASWSVCFFHLGGAHLFGRMKINTFDEWTQHKFNWLDVFNFHFLMLAVPCFMLVSTFLYARKLVWINHGEKHRHIGILKERLKSLLLLATFWPFLWHMGGLTVRWAIGEMVRLNFQFYISAGYSIFYFFTGLMILTTVTHATVLFPRTVLPGFVVSCAITAVLPLLAIRWDRPLYASYWATTNFIPLAFVGAWFAMNFQRIAARPWRAIGIASALAVVFAVYEWNTFKHPVFFYPNGFAMPCYTRPSLFFSAFAALVLCVCFPLTSNRVAAWFGKRGLGLYCLHWFLKDPVKAWLLELVVLSDGRWGWSRDDIAVLLHIPGTAALSYLCTWLLSWYLQPHLLATS